MRLKDDILKLKQVCRQVKERIVTVTHIEGEVEKEKQLVEKWI